MRAHVMSDVHFEFMQKEDGDEFFKLVEKTKREDPANLLILAGDICQVARHEVFWKSKLAQLCGSYDKVLYDPGNHEYYGSSFEEVDRFMESVDQDPNFSNFIQLDHGPFTYEGQRFIGNTMWFPDTQQPRWVKRNMNDFNAIKQFEPNVYLRHKDFLDRVMVNLKAGDVVISHHLPLPASIDPQYRDSDLNPFFMADMSAHLYEGRLPKLWIHGHTHTACDYFHQVGTETMRVYCNPHGYPHEGDNARFWDRIGIDIP